MIKAILVAVLLIVEVVFLGVVLVHLIRFGIRKARKQEDIHSLAIVKRAGIGAGIVLVVMIAFTGITQLTASTPKIKRSNGISELLKIDCNGHKEWISLRGTDKNAPILLFLAGGPGGTQMAATRTELGELEKHFVVVNWDQPGSGKSYSCMKRTDITVETYIKDGIALTEYLRKRFAQKKIYLIGESWGSALGIFLAKEKPEYYAGFIGTGQVIDFVEMEKIDYKKAIEIAREKGNHKLVKRLESQGEPPYYEGNIALKSNNYLGCLSSYMASDPQITNGGYHTISEMFGSEYGVLDSVNYLLGIMNTFNVVYPKLYGTDLRKSHTKLEVPIYIFQGKHDINAPVSLCEEYYKLLQAPQKELVWFDHSGHDPWRNEPERFVEETLRVFCK